jgi:hypothetical protein
MLAYELNLGYSKSTCQNNFYLDPVRLSGLKIAPINVEEAVILQRGEVYLARMILASGLLVELHE